MPLPPDFLQSPHEILAPDARWSPDGGDMFWSKLPPLVKNLRVEVKVWRDGGYRKASQTTAALPGLAVQHGASARRLDARFLSLLLRPARNEIFSGMMLCGF